ncbi:MAG: hypothetical protein JRN16_06265 [Nitrososphaerota archaeon]|nr:hypothetical protein [Nitrososphaerota archaeon]MDG7027995.1 hypothetical protein [Nitrososphaerota archaeon]
MVVRLCVFERAGDSNTRAFNGSLTLQERAYFDNFTFASLNYRPSDVTVTFVYHVVNGTGSLRYLWLNGNSSAPLEVFSHYCYDTQPLPSTTG